MSNVIETSSPSNSSDKSSAQAPMKLRVKKVSYKWHRNKYCVKDTIQDYEPGDEDKIDENLNPMEIIEQYWTDE